MMYPFKSKIYFSSGVMYWAGTEHSSVARIAQGRKDSLDRNFLVKYDCVYATRLICDETPGSRAPGVTLGLSENSNTRISVHGNPPIESVYLRDSLMRN